MLVNCVVGEDYWEYPGCKEIKRVLHKGDQSWMFTGSTDTEGETPLSWIWWKELTHLKRPWCWEKLKAGKEGDNTWWDGRMVPPTQRILDTLNTETMQRKWKPGKLQYMGLQRQEYELPTELKWNERISLLEEDGCCFPSRCVTCVFVCSPVLDVMLAFQDYGGLTVHGFTIAEG